MGNTSSDLSKKYKKVSPVREVMSLLVRNKAAMAGLIFLILLVGVSLSADLLFDYESQVVEQNISERLQWPSAEHLFGTDEYGRDLLARVVHGSRLSLSVSFVSVLASLIIGGILGAVSGYYGGLLDESAGVGSTFVGWKKLYPGLQLSDLYSRSCHHAHDPGAESSGRRAAGCSGPETEIGGHYGGKDD